MRGTGTGVKMAARGPGQAELWRRLARDRARQTGRRLGVDSERAVFLLLAALACLMAAVAARVGLDYAPPSALVLPIVVGSVYLRLREERVLIALVLLALIAEGFALGWSQVRPGNLVIVGLVAAFADQIATTRDRVGVPGLRGESMLAELRDRLRQQGDLPALPGGWRSEVVLSSAGGGSFGGDFLVSASGSGRLELALVDVSGKGVGAATRALLLSGALGGLLGAVPADQFLPAANDYLLRQQWTEGFATAVHLVLDLATGDFRLDAAGHPPGVTFTAGSGSWSLLEPEGPVLGLIEEAKFRAVTGRLCHGDALLLYTDGVIEVPGRDLALGIDKLLGEANRLVVRGFAGGAQRVLAAVAPTAADDRALVMLWCE